MELEDIRQDIDQINRELVALLERRMQLVSQVLAYKQASGIAVADQSREKAILKEIAEQVEDRDYEEAIVGTFAEILKGSREYQEKKLG